MVDRATVKYNYDGAVPRINNINDITWRPTLTIGGNQQLNESGI